MTPHKNGVLKTGVYSLSILDKSVDVLCNQGFMTFQRRFDGSVNFDRLEFINLLRELIITLYTKGRTFVADVVSTLSYDN